MSSGGQSGKGSGVFGQSAGALQGAGQLYKNAANIYRNPMDTTTSPISGGMSRYMNPFTDQVINRTGADIARQTAGQQSMNNARASSMGAFGGSRAGIVEALTNSEAQKNIGDISAGLRSTGFDTAARLSGQDVANRMATGQFNTNTDLARAGGLGQVGGLASALGGQGMDIGRQITQDQTAQGGLQQALAQQVMNLAGGQYQGWQNRPQDMISMILSALGGSPLNANTTTTQNYKPGLYDYISLAAQSMATAAQNAPTAAAGA